MTLEQLAVRSNAFTAADKDEFQRKARVLQSLWRQQHDLPIGEHRGLPLGSRLKMPDAETHLWNFLSDNTKRVVRREVLDLPRGSGKLYARPRIFNDLLSSQPLCFNLFAELQCDTRLATAVLRSITGGRIQDVIRIEFEHSPGRGDPRYSGDRSAFDVFVSYNGPSGKKGFVGIEVKYHENLLGKAARHREQYDQIATKMACFDATGMPHLKLQPLQQLWRDHLLAGIMRRVDGYDEAVFLVVYPEQNVFCHNAVEAYKKCLTSKESFESITLESLVAEIERHADAPWVRDVRDRYLDFSKIDAFVAVDDGIR